MPTDDGYMRIGTLRALLSALPDDGLVVLQKDAEGNGYSPLAGGDVGYYVAETTWSGEVLGDEDDPTDAESCVVLWPVN